MGFTIDDKYKAILQEKQADGFISNKDLAEKVGLSPSACLNRTSELEKQGIIKQITAIVVPQKLGIEMLAYALVNLVSMKPENIAAFMEYVNNCPLIQECYTITGSKNYLLKTFAKNTHAYYDFARDLAAHPAVASLETLVVLGVEKWTTVYPVDLDDESRDEK